MYIEKRSRSILKTISWRIWATITTCTIVYFFTKRFFLAVSVGGIEIIAKMILYFFHERVWNKISFGKKSVKPFVLWFTGLSGSGKSALASRAYDYIAEKGLRVERLDGDVVRSVFPKTGFTKEERDNHIKRVGFLASMLERNGVIVVSSFVSPYQDARNFVRDLCQNFVEIHVDTPIEICEQRDVKGLYKKARAGEIKYFTGIDDPYERPQNPEIVIKTEGQTVEETFSCLKKQIDRYLNI